MNERKIKSPSLKALKLVILCPLALLCLLLCGCGSLSDEEAIARLGELLPRSLAIEEAVWGGGLPFEGGFTPDPHKEGAQYAPVASGAAFDSEMALIAELAQVYTVERAEEIMWLALTGDGEHDPRYATLDGVFCVDAAYEGASLGSDIDLTQAVVTHSNPYAVKIEAPVRYADGTSGIKSFTLANTDGVWLLDSPTYVRK
ncbi:MAG: hypothetical protein E7655_05850 [Ruminococcaceae bacterium]|nr:hypothetical protein [Oscillospiraceae bacterium]